MFPGWGLLDGRTAHPVDPPALVAAGGGPALKEVFRGLVHLDEVHGS
jgi:hypothetical protein